MTRSTEIQRLHLWKKPRDHTKTVWEVRASALSLMSVVVKTCFPNFAWSCIWMHIPLKYSMANHPPPRKKRENPRGRSYRTSRKTLDAHLPHVTNHSYLKIFWFDVFINFHCPIAVESALKISTRTVVCYNGCRTCKDCEKKSITDRII